jgi:multidrug efflux pump subunit AcrA (membrane-fusion protein)
MEDLFDDELAKLVEENKISQEKRDNQKLKDLQLEKTRTFEQAKLLEEVLSVINKSQEPKFETNQEPKEEDKLADDYDELSEKLKQEENLIRLDNKIKDELRRSELEFEKTRASLQSKFIVQALLSVSQSANAEELDENSLDGEESSIENSDVVKEAVIEEEVIEEVIEEEVIEEVIEEEVIEEEVIEEEVIEEEIIEEEIIEEEVKPVSQIPKKKIQILKSNINGKDILLVKRAVAKAAGLDDNNKTLKNPGLLKEAKLIEDYEEEISEPLKKGISIVNEDGIDYVVVNGIKIDTKTRVVKTLGIDANLLKDVDHQKVSKDDSLHEDSLEDTESSIRKELKKKNGKKKRKRVIIWLFVLAIIIGGAYIYNFYNINRRLPWAEAKLLGADSTTYVDAKVEEQITNPKVKITGSLEAADLQTVVLRTNGAIKSINVKEGDIVKKGDVLVTVDDTTEQYNIANLESQLKSAQLMGNANNVKLLELQLDNAKNNLEYTKATANFDGVVAEQGWTVGDYNSLTVNNSNNMIIADLSEFKATVTIDELDIGYVEVGEQVELSFDSLPGIPVNAFVSSIPMLGYYSRQGFGVLNVEITIPNPPKKLKTGFTFSGTIVSANEESIVVVNQAAITSSGDNSIVRIKMADGSLKDFPVTVRYLGENKCQILSGDIFIGDTVVIENAKSFAEQKGINLGK